MGYHALFGCFGIFVLDGIMNGKEMFHDRAGTQTCALPISLIEGSSRTIVEHLFSIHDAIENKDAEAAKQSVITHIDYIEKSLKKALSRGDA